MIKIATTLICITSMLLPIALPTAGWAKKKKGRTQLEQFYSEKGTIVVIETEHMGSTYTGRGARAYVAVSAVVIYLPGRDDKVLKGIKLTVYRMDNRKQVSTAYIDSSELPSLYKAMMYILKARNRTRKQRKNLHITYMTKGDFSVGYIQEKSGQFNYYYRIKEETNGTTTNYRFPANKKMMRDLKKLIRKGVKYLNKHTKKLKKPKNLKKKDSETTT